jgi:hypothetical protein
MISASCHCGAVIVTVPRRPRRLTSCNCSMCRRTGALMAYYKVGSVKVKAGRRNLEAYSWGDRTLRFMRCRHCGCLTHWEPIRGSKESRMGVNARNFDPEVIAGVRVRQFDGASSWRFLS